jgi:hypothetical protein
MNWVGQKWILDYHQENQVDEILVWPNNIVLTTNKVVSRERRTATTVPTEDEKKTVNMAYSFPAQ